MSRTVELSDMVRVYHAFFVGQVGTGATDAVVPVQGKTYVPNAWNGGAIYFLNGTAQGQTGAISTNTTTQINVTHLTSAPSQGDKFILYQPAQVNVTVSSPQNVAQIGGVAVPGNPIGTVGGASPTVAQLIGGTDGTDLRALNVDASGVLTTKTGYAEGQPGSATPANALFIGGTDGTDLRALATDTLGRQVTTATGTLTNRSGTITAGGTAQVLMAVNASRKYLLVQNPSAATESLWINFTTAAVESQPSIELTPGQGFLMEAGFISTEAVSVIAATTGHAFTAKEG